MGGNSGLPAPFLTNMTYYRKTIAMWKFTVVLVAFVTLALANLAAWATHKIEASQTFISPVVGEFPPLIFDRPVSVPVENADTWIDRYADQFTTGEANRAYMKYQLHCLLWKESRGGTSDNHGDGGLAGGSYQFHQNTWDWMRQQMLNRGLVAEIGSRYDLRQAIQTTAWALANGRSRDWGPLRRGECR